MSPAPLRRSFPRAVGEYGSLSSGHIREFRQSLMLASEELSCLVPATWGVERGFARDVEPATDPFASHGHLPKMDAMHLDARVRTIMFRTTDRPVQLAAC